MTTVTCPDCGFAFEPIPGKARVFCVQCGRAIDIEQEAPAVEDTAIQEEAPAEAEPIREEVPEPEVETAEEEISEAVPAAEESNTGEHALDDVPAESAETEAPADDNAPVMMPQQQDFSQYNTVQQPYDNYFEPYQQAMPVQAKKPLKTPLIIAGAVIAAAALFFALWYFLLRPVYITSIKIDTSGYDKDRDAVVLNIGDSYETDYSLAPADNRYDDLTWSSSDEKVASVNDGIVTATGKGECTVSAVSEKGVTAEIKIFVEIPAEKIVLSASSVKIMQGNTAVISVGFTPEDTTDKHCTWETSDKKVATVNDGIVTAVGKGTCTITVTSVYGPSAECEIKVTAPTPESLIVGTWTGFYAVNSQTGSKYYLSDSADKLIVNSDGTAVNYYGTYTDNFTWKYVKTNSDGNYVYLFYFEDGHSATAMYFTGGSSKDCLGLAESRITTLYKKTTTSL